MGYTIIFQTKIITLPDGRILHLERSGCNNDTEGRVKNRFRGVLYRKSEFWKKVQMVQQNYPDRKDPNAWDMQIGSRKVPFHEYGKHLWRMYRRGITWESLIRQRDVWAEAYNGVTCFPKDGSKPVDYTPEEWSKRPIHLDGKLRVNRKITSDLSEIITMLEEGKDVEFVLGDSKMKKSEAKICL